MVQCRRGSMGERYERGGEAIPRIWEDGIHRWGRAIVRPITFYHSLPPFFRPSPITHTFSSVIPTDEPSLPLVISLPVITRVDHTSPLSLLLSHAKPCPISLVTLRYYTSCCHPRPHLPFPNYFLSKSIKISLIRPFEMLISGSQVHLDPFFLSVCNVQRSREWRTGKGNRDDHGG